MSDWESIQNDVVQEQRAQEQHWEDACKESALEQCIYLFVEGESEEVAFRILLEEGLGINFQEFGIVIVNYNGLGNLKHAIRIMNLTLSHERPMIFTFDDDDKSIIKALGVLPKNIHLFKVPSTPIVTFSNGQQGGSFEESFKPSDFINACFETAFLKANPQIAKQDFIDIFDSKKPFYDQIVKFLQQQALQTYILPKPEIAENMAVACSPEPDTYIKLANLIKQIRTQTPVKVKI
jgi:predicted ATP-dependent endonuclease of OLD family